MNFKDSKTYENLLTAFHGELNASSKYKMYEEIARDEGYEQIGNIFNETSGNELEHGEIWNKYLNEGSLPNTSKNLLDSYTSEFYEWTTMYPEFARIAREEGYSDIARHFDGVGAIERHHYDRFRELAKQVDNGTVFCKDTPSIWICTNCGNIYFGKCAPEHCPVCNYPQGYYKENCNC